MFISDSSATNSTFLLFDDGLPQELHFKICSYLKRSELFVAMQVCKLWLTATQQPQFWEKEIKVLELENPSMDVINERVNSLRKTATEADALLTENVMTAQELDAMLLPNHPEWEKTNERWHNELDRKLSLSEKLQRGFQVSILLERLGIKTISHLESYAVRFETKYGTAKGWAQIASLLIDNGKIEKALEIFKNHLEKSYSKWDLLRKIIGLYLEQNSTEKAINLLNSHQNDDVWGNEMDNCYLQITNFADRTKDMALLEKAIDLFSQKLSNFLVFQSVIALAESYYLQKKVADAQRCLTKYSVWLDQISRDLHAYILIKLYVQLGKCAQAWKLALEWKTRSKNTSIYALRNALKEFNGSQADIQRVESLIATFND